MCAEGMGCGRRWVIWVLRGTGTANKTLMVMCDSCKRGGGEHGGDSVSVKDGGSRITQERQKPFLQ